MRRYVYLVYFGGYGWETNSNRWAVFTSKKRMRRFLRGNPPVEIRRMPLRMWNECSCWDSPTAWLYAKPMEESA